ncbi:hypothetical protein BIW11_00119 [Tropilaelaps mercedesae]|uniref:Uncharacterized protein n=1 Tax=Tropilaelaps mercedesae TaxID=418985 RepID=A0A1V9Y1U6_9ACAR|nr:hypothetical protein BIW11_00119 [Tropilaelaps mercedesae]
MSTINDKLEDQLEQHRRRDDKREQQLRRNAKMPFEDQLQQVRNLLGKLRRLLRSEECHLMIDTVEQYVLNNTCKNACNGPTATAAHDPSRTSGATSTAANSGHHHHTVGAEQRSGPSKLHAAEPRGSGRAAGERRQR